MATDFDWAWERKGLVAAAGYSQAALPLGPYYLTGPTVLEVYVMGRDTGWSFWKVPGRNRITGS